MKQAMKNVVAAVSAVACWMTALAGTLSVSSDATLTADAAYDAVNVATDVTLNLNGHRLTTGSVSGGGAIISAKFDEGVYATTGDTLLDGLTTQNSSNYGYVDTGYEPTATDRVETKITFGSTISGTWWIFGSSDDQNKRMFDLYISYGFKLQCAGNSTTFTAPIANSSYEIIADGAKGFASVSKDGAAATVYNWTPTSYTQSRNISLLNQKVSSSNRGAWGLTMHYFRVFDSDGNLKVNMLPVKRPDGTLCFYDTVRKTYHAYAWASGQTEPTLTEGSDISYYALDYVKTPTDYPATALATGYTPGWSDHVMVKVKLGTYNSQNRWILSASGNTVNRMDFCGLTSGKISMVINSTTYEISAYKAGDVYELDIDGYAGAASIAKNEIVTNIEWTAAAYTPSQQYCLFYQKLDGTDQRQMTDCTMYYMHVADTNGYVRLDLQPAKKKDGTVGFYDVVRNAFLVPSTGSLEGGSELPRDLTSAGGTCYASIRSSGSSDTYAEAKDSGTSVANLFRNNFIYEASPTNRLYVRSVAVMPLRIDYDFGEGNEKVVNMYRLYSGDTSQFYGAWTFYGSNDSTAYKNTTDEGWTVLDEQSENQATPEASGQAYTKAFANSTAYRYYRLKVTTEKTSGYFSLTQLEYFNVAATANPGRLVVNVPSGTDATSAGVSLGGDMKVVAEVDGTLTTSITNRFYTGGTEVVSNGVYCLAAPMTIPSLSLSEDTTLGFLFANKTTAPMLTLDSAASLPSPLKIATYAGGDFVLGGNGLAITSGYDFSGTTISYAATDWARRVLVGDASGNLWAYGPNGLIIMFR